MNFFNLFPNNTKCIKLPLVINTNGLVFIPDDLKYTILNETMGCDSKYLVTVNTSSGLPLTKNGIPFIPILFVNIIDEYADYTQPDRDRLKLDYKNVFN
jgi:hypothetical protein